MAGKGRGGSPTLDAAPLEGAAVATMEAPTSDATIIETVAPNQAEEENAEFAFLPLESIAESPHNPRKHFDAAEMADLTASVKLDGVWEPILVRPHPSGHGVYELASGHRRFRASKGAGRSKIPALIRTLDNETFIKVLTISNLQREDVHPLEQADAFAVQMKEFGWKPDRIAIECGKGETYVYDHLKFLVLIEPVRELFFADRIKTAHAVELSRLTASQQELAIDRQKGGLWQSEHFKAGPELEMALEEDHPTDPYRGLKAKTFRELRTWIHDYLRFDSESADPVLFPAAATVVQQAPAQKLKVVSITWDSHIRDEAKSEAEKTYSPAFWQRADGAAGTKVCEHSAAVRGVVRVGDGWGDAFAICMARDKCTVHWADRIKDRAKAEKRREKEATSGKPPAEPSESEYDRRERLREESNTRTSPHVDAVLEAFATVVKKAPATSTGPLSAILFDGDRFRRNRRGVELITRGRTADDFVRFLAWQEITDGVNDYDLVPSLTRLGKEIGVDVKAMLKKLEGKPVPAKPASAKAPARKAAKKKRGAR